MRVSQAKELFRSLTAEYFVGAEVTLSRQSRVAKPNIALVSITPGNVKRPLNPAYKEIGGEMVGHYQSRISMQVDLFTHGAPVIDDETGRVVAYENTAMDDMLAFVDFLNSQYVVEWCHRNDVAISFDGDPQDLTGLVNDNNYEFRSRLPVLFYFTQKAVGHTAVFDESSIQYPTGEKDPEIGEPIYTPEEPEDTESSSGQYDGADYNTEDIVVPKFEQSSSGGGSEELAQKETGYFTEVDIKEEKSQ